MVAVVGVLVGAEVLSACGKQHKPIDTTKVFNVESTFGSDFKSQTKGPVDIDPKLLGPQRMPNGVTYDPADCGDYYAGNGRPPKGIRGKMSAVAAVGNGNRFTVIALQADKDMPYDAATAEKCQHVSMQAGKISGYLEEVEAPHIDGVQTAGTHSETEMAGKDGQSVSRQAYTFTAYLGDAMVEVKAEPLIVRGQPPAQVDTDRARQLLTDAVAAVRAK